MVVSCILFTNQIMDAQQRAAILGRISEEDVDGHTNVPTPTLITQDNLRAHKYSADDCWACKYVNDKVIEDNFRVRKLWLLYTENKCRVSSEILSHQMLEYYNRWLKPMYENFEWTQECIFEHITLHTFYPTDELYEQIASLKAVRAKLADNLFYFDDDGTEAVNFNNIKTWLAVCKEVRLVMELRPRVPNMIGYSKCLNF